MRNFAIGAMPGSARMRQFDRVIGTSDPANS
jgi:hypothetical protein